MTKDSHSQSYFFRVVIRGYQQPVQYHISRLFIALSSSTKTTGLMSRRNLDSGRHRSMTIVIHYTHTGVRPGPRSRWRFASSFPPASGFTGNIAKFIGVRFAMIFYAMGPVRARAHTAGPTHGGAPTPPHTFGAVEEERVARPREGEAGREAEGNAITSLLFWYLYQCARCSHPPKSS